MSRHEELGMRADSTRSETTEFAAIAAPALRGWRVIAGALLVAWTLVIVAVLAPGRRYRAEAKLSTVSTQRALPTGGLAAGLLGTPNLGGGVQLTPGLVVRIARMDAVLYRVGTRRLGADTAGVADRLAGKRVPAERVVRTVRTHVVAQFEVQTGIITLAVEHRDTALARAVLDALVREVTGTYRTAARAQAREIREAQQVRVDSAERRLRAAEEALAAFLARNREVNRYTPEHVEMQALERQVERAAEMHGQALADRDLALGKELEETPAVVVVAAPPPVLAPVPRGLALRLVLVTMVLVVVLWVALLAIDRMRRSASRPTPAQAEAFAAAAALPGLGRLVRRLTGQGR